MNNSQSNILAQTTDADFARIATEFGFAVATTSNPSAFYLTDAEGKKYLFGRLAPAMRGTNWFNPGGRVVSRV